MNEYQRQKRSNYIKKLVSNSRAMLTNQITILLGVVKMNKLITWISLYATFVNFKMLSTII
jgi:hypothetical protein